MKNTHINKYCLPEKIMAIKKISENIWEIEKEGKMNVHGIIFASDKLMEQIKKEEKTTQQIKNVAMLPGIVEKSIAMSDAHMGYGFPIGGVAAFDLKKGVISPGGIGYDINCTDGETEVLLNHGAYIKIKEIEKHYRKEVNFVNLADVSLQKSNIIYYMKRPEKEYIYEIKTKTGKSIKVTEDHPIYTQEGMKNAGKLNKEDKIAICAFKGVPYQEPQEQIIINKEDILKVITLKRSSTVGNVIPQIINILTKLNLLPLKYSSYQLPYLAKLVGYIFGDGCMSFINGKEGVVSFHGKEEDLTKIREDISAIGFTPSRIYKRLRNHTIKTYYKEYKFTHIEYSIKVTSTAFVSLLTALGVPLGMKTNQPYAIPIWLWNAPLWIKRLFLAAFFGAEMSAPKTINKYNFNALTLGMNKIIGLEINAIEFLEQIRKMLKEFEINTTKIMKVKEYRTKSKNGDTCGYRMQINGESKNLIKFFERVSYVYNNEKFRQASLAANYLLLKNKIKEKRMGMQRIARVLYEQRSSANQVCTLLIDGDTPIQFIKHSLWSKNKEIQRMTFDFMSFAEYKSAYSFGNNGLAWDGIEGIEKKPFDDLVYDITINNDNHNFIANCFIVSNCGVRLLQTNLTKEEFLKKRELVLNELYKNIPSGVGEGGEFKLSDKEIDGVLKNGSHWTLNMGYATSDDIEKTEDSGCIKEANPTKISQKAKARGRNQLGTIGAGNHFLEVQEVETIYDENIANTFGLKNKDQICIMIHTGSRGLGHQNASDYIQKMEKEHGWKHLPDRELICAPIESELGKNFFAAMASAANFAFCNRQLITYQVRKSFNKFFPKSEIKVVYDIAHNIAKFEEYEFDGKKQILCVHRKGATRSFGPGRKEIPEVYRKIGCPIFIPGSMGTYSYVLVGTKKAEEISFGSTAHGAGRVLSRTYAKKNINPEHLKQELAQYGVAIRAGSVKGLLEEAPEAYKDVNEVVRVSHELGIGNLVVRLKPLAVVKG